MKRSDFGRSHSLIRFSQQNEQIIYIAFARNLGGPDIEGVISPNRTTAYLSIPGWEVVTDIACNQSPTSANAIRFDTIDTQIQSNKERLFFSVMTTVSCESIHLLRTGWWFIVAVSLQVFSRGLRTTISNAKPSHYLRIFFFTSFSVYHLHLRVHPSRINTNQSNSELCIYSNFQRDLFEFEEGKWSVFVCECVFRKDRAEVAVEVTYWGIIQSKKKR